MPLQEFRIEPVQPVRLRKGGLDLSQIERRSRLTPKRQFARFQRCDGSAEIDCAEFDNVLPQMSDGLLLGLPAIACGDEEFEYRLHVGSGFVRHPWWIVRRVTTISTS